MSKTTSFVNFDIEYFTIDVIITSAGIFQTLFFQKRQIQMVLYRLINILRLKLKYFNLI